MQILILYVSTSIVARQFLIYVSHFLASIYIPSLSSALNLDN